jgi:hypothetical protein
LQNKFAQYRLQHRARLLRLALKDNYFLRNTLGLDKQEYISVIAKLETDLARCRTAYISQQSLLAENQRLKNLNEELVSAVDDGAKREKDVIELLRIAENDNDVLRNTYMVEKREFTARIKALEESVSITFGAKSTAWEASKMLSYTPDTHFAQRREFRKCL